MAIKCKHDPLKVSLIFTTICIYSIVVVLNQLSARKILFSNDVGEISRLFPLDISPASIVFPIIWSTIYLWQAVWLIYTVTLLFRRSLDGEPLYRKINILNNGLFIAFILNNLGLIAWLFLWDNKLLLWSFLTLTYLTLCLYVAFYIALRISYNYNDDLIRLRLTTDVWLIRILIQNGLAFFLTWTTIASTLNMAIFLTHGVGIDMTVAGTTALIIIFVIMTVYFVMENFIWQRYLLYVFTPWCVILIGLVGSLVKNWKPSPTRNNIITLVVVVFAVAYTICKIVMFSLYQTVCKPRVDKKESHKLLQAKEGRSSS